MGKVYYGLSLCFSWWSMLYLVGVPFWIQLWIGSIWWLRKRRIRRVKGVGDCVGNPNPVSDGEKESNFGAVVAKVGPWIEQTSQGFGAGLRRNDSERLIGWCNYVTAGVLSAPKIEFTVNSITQMAHGPCEPKNVHSCCDAAQPLWWLEDTNQVPCYSIMFSIFHSFPIFSCTSSLVLEWNFPFLQFLALDTNTSSGRRRRRKTMMMIKRKTQDRMSNSFFFENHFVGACNHIFNLDGWHITM